MQINTAMKYLIPARWPLPKRPQKSNVLNHNPKYEIQNNKAPRRKIQRDSLKIVA